MEGRKRGESGGEREKRRRLEDEEEERQNDEESARLGMAMRAYKHDLFSRPGGKWEGMSTEAMDFMIHLDYLDVTAFLQRLDLDDDTASLLCSCSEVMHFAYFPEGLKTCFCSTTKGPNSK